VSKQQNKTDGVGEKHSCGGCDDIDRFLLDEGYSPMLTYDSDGHFREDDAYAKLDEDDEGDADIDSYN